MKSTKLIGKVLIGLLLTGAVLSIAIIFMYRSIHDVSLAVDEAGKPNERLIEWKKTVNLLYEAENKSRSWRITKDEAELKSFDSIRTAVSIHLTKLYELNRDSIKGLALCDSLHQLSEERFEMLGDWINFTDETTPENTVLVDILRVMAQREKLVMEENERRIDSVSSEDRSRKIAASEKERSFWRRLVKKKNKTSLPIAASDSTKQKDSLIPVVGTDELRKTIRTGQIRVESKADAVLLEESRLLKANQQIMTRIHTVSDQYEKLCGAETSEKLREVSRASSQGTQSVMRWAIVAALCIILFSLFFIRRDIVRNRKLQAQLLVAKEHAEHLAKTKEEFMANMSHEIRNPLNVISGFSTNLLKANLDEKSKKYVEGISRSSEFLISLVNDILDISKVKSGKLQLERISFPLDEIRIDLENAFGTHAKEKGLFFNIQIAKTLPATIIGDPVRFRQILFNLISNALKFTDSGFISTKFEEVVDASGAKKLLISVADSGIGISKNKTETIFEEFEQADASITRKYGGTGLGLSIIRALVSQMNGSIAIESEHGKGTTFTITLPLEEGEVVGMKKTEQHHYNPSFLTGKTILICDDDPMNRLLASHLVKTYHGIVKEASGGKETLEILSKEKVDLILLDLEMPDMSGEETVILIRNLEEEKSNVKIIAVTGRNKNKVHTNLDAVDGFVQKPYKENDMLNEINRVLELQKN